MNKKKAYGECSKNIQSAKQNVSKDSEIISFPLNKNVIFYIFLAVSFLAPFIIYLLTLAPTVTLEDSGELVTAARYLGVPHEPGYPLFTIFGKIFSLIPIGSIAYRVNMMSAFFNSLATLFLFMSFMLILEETFIKTNFWKNTEEKLRLFFTYSVALSGALFWAYAYETWEQSVIAEVYGVNDFFLALFIFAFLKWRRQIDENIKTKYFYYLCFVTGLAVTTHTTAVMLVPVLGGYILIYDRKLFLNLKKTGKSILYFIAGLTPWLYLPFASLRNPPVDWGNPENLLNMFRVIMRHQYQSQDSGVKISGSETFGFFYTEMLPEQWYLIFSIIIPLGLYILFKKNRSLFYFILFFLIMSIPVMSYMTRDYLSNDENKTLISIAYIPAYMLLSMLISIGLYYIVSVMKPVKTVIITSSLIVLLLPFSSVGKNYKNLDMHQYYFAQEYADNIFNTLPQNSLLFINWDPFGFPMTYYQFVENKRKDILVLDELLLKRTWYIQWLRNYYPEFMKLSQIEVDEFLKAVAPFEAGENYDGNIIQQKYIGMINSFIDNRQKTGNSVYYTYYPEKDIMRNYHLEPQFSAYKYTNATTLDSLIDDKNISFKYFLDSSITKDRMANYMSEYYGDLYASRAAYLEQAGKIKEAKEYFIKSLSLFSPQNKKTGYIRKHLPELENLLKKN